MRDGWVESPLGDVVSIVNGGTPPTKMKKFWEGSIVWITTTELTAFDGKKVVSSKRTITDDGLRSGTAKLVRAGTTLVGTTATIGTCAIADCELTFNQQISGLIPIDDNLDDAYLFYWVQHIKPILERLSAGTSFKRISTSTLRNVVISLPPLPKQKRIVDLISSVDSYIEALQQQREFAKQTLQALCQKIFLAEGDSVQLHTVATCIMGQSPEGFTCNKDGIGTPLLTGPTEFQQNNWVGLPRQWTTNETKISISQDILFCVRGATAGRMNLTNYRSVIGRGLAAIRCEDPLDTHFVRFALQTGLNQLLPAAGGTIFPNISQSQLRSFKLPWPNEVERRFLASLFKSVEDNSETLGMSITATRNLRSSLLHHLISGEYELPASYDDFIGAA